MSTSFPTAGKIARKWYVVDATNQTLGRLATQVAHILAGKHNPQYTPFIDTGDHVVVINAAKVKLTGMKAGQKVYRHYTGYPGGLREEQLEKRAASRTEAIGEDGIKGMIQRTTWSRAMGSKLKVYRNDKHTHAAQKAELLQVAK